MSDELIQLPGRQIDIPARFVRQAYEHIQHTNPRYVTFLFTGEAMEDAVCVGVTTRLMLTDQRPQAATPKAEPAPAPKSKNWTVKTLNENIVLGVVREHGPINTRNVGDRLGIPSGEMLKRQKVQRMLAKLRNQGVIRNLNGDGRYPRYEMVEGQSIPPTMPLRKQRARTITRKHVTEDVVMEQIRTAGTTTSKAIGDALHIPRDDNHVRGKITEHIGKLRKAGRLREVEGRRADGGRVYELVDEANVA